jgi:hypothetical protein
MKNRNEFVISIAQLFALHLASHYKLKRSSMGWWAESRESVGMLHRSTIKALLRKGLLEGDPDSKVWTNQLGKELLEEIRRDTGIFYDFENDELTDQRVH